MVVDSAMENKQCPICWKGVLYNTGIRQRKGLHHFFFQCSFCGKTMTRDKYKRLLKHMKHPGAPMGKTVKGMKASKAKVKVVVPHPGFVVGVVRDARTGKPIEMAHACLKGRSIEAFTNKYGQYALEPVPEHKAVEIEFTSPGHAKKVHIFKYGIRGGEVRKLDMRLTPTRQIKKPAGLEKTTPIPIYKRGGEVGGTSRSGIEGVVKDVQGDPIFAALVTVFHHERILIIQTDTMGHYELVDVLPPGDYMVRAAAYGYSFERKWVRIGKDRVLRCDFVLTERKTIRA